MLRGPPSHTLQTERAHYRAYATRDQARRDLYQYIKGIYNSRRLHSALGYISPAEAERRAANPVRFSGPAFRGRATHQT